MSGDLPISASPKHHSLSSPKAWFYFLLFCDIIIFLMIQSFLPFRISSHKSGYIYFILFSPRGWRRERSYELQLSGVLSCFCFFPERKEKSYWSKEGTSLRKKLLVWLAVGPWVCKLLWVILGKSLHLSVLFPLITEQMGSRDIGIFLLWCCIGADMLTVLKQSLNPSTFST